MIDRRQVLQLGASALACSALGLGARGAVANPVPITRPN